MTLSAVPQCIFHLGLVEAWFYFALQHLAGTSTGRAVIESRTAFVDIQTAVEVFTLFTAERAN